MMGRCVASRCGWVVIPVGWRGEDMGKVGSGRGLRGCVPGKGGRDRVARLGEKVKVVAVQVACHEVGMAGGGKGARWHGG